MLIQYVDGHGEIMTLRAIETLDRLVLSGLVKANTLIREGVEDPWVEAAFHPLTTARFPAAEPARVIAEEATTKPTPQSQSSHSIAVAQPSSKAAPLQGDRNPSVDHSLSAVLRLPQERWAGFIERAKASAEPQTPKSPREVFEFFFSFSGRISRQGYWLRLVTIFVLYTLSRSLTGAGGFLGGVVAVVAACAVFSAAVRRIHDIDQPGHWSLLLMVPIVNIVMAVAWGALTGTPGSNEYGPAPLQSNFSGKQGGEKTK